MGLRDVIQVVFERDPAAKSPIEVILAYPGVHALAIHRIAHPLYQIGVPVIPRLISHCGRFLTGIEIHPGATIGKGFFIDHGMGVVIGETSIVGDNCTLYQGVTLGGTGKEVGKRHPTLGNGVVVGVGAKVLGDIYIGDNSRIGAGSVVLKDVPPNATAVGIPAKIVAFHSEAGIRRVEQMPDPQATMINCLQRKVLELEDRVILVEKGRGEQLAESTESKPLCGGELDEH
jgi:serine O-acetyltransferase